MGKGTSNDFKVVHGLWDQHNENYTKELDKGGELTDAYGEAEKVYNKMHQFVLRGDDGKQAYKSHMAGQWCKHARRHQAFKGFAERSKAYYEMMLKMIIQIKDSTNEAHHHQLITQSPTKTKE